jgi:hypothetical protein
VSYQSEAEGTSGGEFMALAGQLTGFAVIALPAVGVAIRFLTFQFGGVDAPFTVATAASVRDLAAEAALPMTGAMIATFAGLFITRERRSPALFGQRAVLKAIVKRHETGETDIAAVAAEAKRQLAGIDARSLLVPTTPFWRGAEIAIVLLTLATLVLFAPLGVGAPLAVLAGLGSAWVAGAAARRHGDVKLRNVWPLIPLFLAAATLTGSLAGSLYSIHAERIEFAAGAPLDNGPYVILGEDGSRWLLATCEEPDNVLTIDTAQVLLSELIGLKSGDVSFASMVLDRDLPDIGFEPMCSR